MKLWIARDKDDTLWVYYCDRPQRMDSSFALHSHSHIEWCEKIHPNYFPDLTWENSPKELIVKMEDEK